MSCLVILELENGVPTRPSLATISASREISKDIDVLIIDSDSKAEVEKLTNAKNIYYLSENSENLIAEQMVDILKDLSQKFDHILAPSGTFSKNFMPRLAAVLDKQMISDVIKIHDLSEDQIHKK